MPSRILRDWTDSLRFDGLSAEAERLFTRLIMKADDYGRFHADPRLLRAGCFPLSENLRANDLDRWLDELSNRQLILRYEAAGRRILAIINFGQRLKQSRWKFPPPPGEPDNFLPMATNSPGSPPNSPGSSPHFPESSGKIREAPGNPGKLREGDVKHREVESASPEVPAGREEKRNEPELDLGSDAKTKREGAGAPSPLAERPNEAEFLAECQRRLVPEWFAREKFLSIDAGGWEKIRNWRSKAGQVRCWYEEAGKPLNPHRRNGAKPTQTEAERDQAKTGLASTAGAALKRL